MALTKQEYEKALGKPISDEQYAKLSNLPNEPYQSRPDSAYEGATTMASKDKSGIKYPVDRGMPSVGVVLDPTGKKHSLPNGLAGVEMYENRTGKLSKQPAMGAVPMTTLDYLRAEMGGPDYKAPAPVKLPLQEMVAAGGGTPMSVAGKQVPYNPAWNTVGPADGTMLPSTATTSPMLPNVPVTTTAPSYASGMTATPVYAPPAGLIALDEDLKKKSTGAAKK